MSNQGKIKILISFLLFSLAIIFTSLAIQKYQVSTQTRADDTQSIDVTFTADTPLGLLNPAVGFILADIADTELVDNIISTFKVANQKDHQSSILIKTYSPTVETIQHGNFIKLQDNGFRWYFSFPDFTNVEAVLAEYYKTYDSEVIVEINNYSNFDVSRIAAIKETYPEVKFHGAEFIFWPRGEVKDLLTRVQPPQLDAVSIKTLVDDQSKSVQEYVLLMFDTFWDAGKDAPGESGIEVNFPANTLLALSDIETHANGEAPAEQARRFGTLTSAIAAAVPSQNREGNAPLKYVLAGEYAKMSTLERKILLGYAHIMNIQPEAIWPNLSGNNGNAMLEVNPLIGTVGYKDNAYYGVFTNVTTDPLTINLPDDIDLSSYKTLSDQKGAGDMITDENHIELQGYETVYMFPSSAWQELQQQTSLTPGPTAPATGATPFPTLPDVPQAAGQLICDAGTDPYDSTVIRVTNNTNETIDDLTSVVHRCEYIPGKIRKGYYKCETCLDGDEVNNPDCQVGIFDADSSIVEFTLAPGETKELTMTVNPCEIAQLDVYNTDENAGDSPMECFNPRSQYTDPAPPSRWQGGIGFAIDENATGYNEATGSCEVPTPTTPPPTNTPPEEPTDTPTDTPIPTATHTPAPTDTPIPTNTPLPTNTPIPTNTPLPTNPPLPTQPPPPTNPPVTALVVNEQAPGVTPWAIIAVPLGLILIGLLL